MSSKGYKQTEEHKKRISDSHKARGDLHWGKRLEVRDKISKTLTGRKLSPRSEETKRKISESEKGTKKPPRTEEWCRKQREYKISHPNRKFKDTGIELKIELELVKRKINFQKQVPLCKVARVDFYLPEYRIVIQCDGDYWHGCPIHKPQITRSRERDRNQDSILTFNGFNVYRFWECEINESVENCINKLKMFGY